MEASAQLSRPPWPASRPLRAWQQRAVARSTSGPPGLPGLGHAGGGQDHLRPARRPPDAERRVRPRVCVVGPTTHICRQWAADAAPLRHRPGARRPNADGPESADFHGVAVTYQTIAAGPELHRRAAGRAATLLIADEPHHMGDLAAWGLQPRRAFDGARFRLLLSGTPFRSDNTAIPWVTYDEDGVSRADYVYGYTEALVDRVCRPITFLRLRRRDGVGLGRPAAQRRLRPRPAARRSRPGACGRRSTRRASGWARCCATATPALSEVRADGPPRRGRPGDRLRQGARAGDRGAARGDPGRAPPVVMSDEPGASRPRSPISPPPTSAGWSRC